MPSTPSSLAASPAHTALIFDFEGTLVDFQWQLAAAETELRAALADLGFSGAEFDQGNYATLWNAAADLCATPQRLAELRRVLHPIYDRWDSDALSRWSPRPGAAELLRHLVADGRRLAMVSNIGRTALTEALQRFGFGARLAPIVCRDEVKHMKPSTEGILRVLAEWQLAPDAALFVGDSRADVFAARAAGVPVVIIRGGEGDESMFADHPPDHMISRLDELIELLAGSRS